MRSWDCRKQFKVHRPAAAILSLSIAYFIMSVSMGFCPRMQSRAALCMMIKEPLMS